MHQGLRACTGSSVLEICLATTRFRLKMWQETEEVKASQDTKRVGPGSSKARAGRWPCLPSLLSVTAKHGMYGFSVLEAEV